MAEVSKTKKRGGGRRRRRKGAEEPFVMVPESWIGALHDAGCSSVEIEVFLALAMHPQRNGLLSRPVNDYGASHDTIDKKGISSVTHLPAPQISRATKNLCTRRLITLPDGTKVPVLTQKVQGHRGKVAVYQNNLNRLSKPMTAPTETKKVGGEPDQKDGEKVNSPVNQNNKKKVNSGDNSVLTAQPTHLEKKQGDGAKKDPRPPWLR